MIKQSMSVPLQASVAYHHAEVMLASARIMTGEYKTDKVLKARDSEELLSEDELLQREIIRMKTHARALQILKTRDNAPATDRELNVTISEVTDEVLEHIYGSELMNKVKGIHLESEWKAMFYVNKIHELDVAFVDTYGINPPKVTISM